MLKSRLLLLLLAASPLYAQTPYLVKDINTSAITNPRSSTPGNFFKFGSRVFFAANTSLSGTELYSTDGTASGTALVADIYPGSQSSSPSDFAVLNGKLVFDAVDSRGQELWVTDGTSAGTKLLADILPTGSSSPGPRVVYHGQMYFSAVDGVNGNELWITDGTPGGTKFFKDLNPGPKDSSPNSFVVFNDLIYFAANGALWKSDGTAAGTTVVKAVPGAARLVIAGSKIFFSDSSANLSHLWVSDGTEAGTHPVLDSATASGVLPIPFGDRVLFTARDDAHGFEPWISDGTAAGTHLIRDTEPGPENGASFSLTNVAILGGTAYFGAFGPVRGKGLWKTDGTEAGTVPVRDDLDGFSSLVHVFAAGGRVVFTVQNNNSRASLWSSDGTAAGTTKISDAELAIFGFPLPPVVIDNTLYFSGFNSLNGFEPWKSDGTAGGTAMIANIASDPTPSSRPLALVAAGDWLYFDAWDGKIEGSNFAVNSFWRTDGTPEGTLKLSDKAFTVYGTSGHTALAMPSSGYWWSEGTPESTRPATDLTSQFKFGPIFAGVAHDKLFLGGTDLHNVDALFVAPFRPGASILPLPSQSGAYVTEYAGRALYVNGGLWSTDGTPAGTFLVKPAAGQNPSPGVVANGLLFFLSDNGQKLWRSNGSPDGTFALDVSNGSFLMPAGRNLFFVNQTTRQLWVTDGTQAGTRALPATWESAGGAALGDRLIFAASDAAHGMEPWISDGTADGTHLLSDMAPGIVESQPAYFINANGSIYFSAFSSIGRELWVTDGTAAGTRLAAKIEPTTLGSSPEQLTRAGEKLYFVANTLATGAELWALPLPPSVSIDDVTVVEGSSGTTARFHVTLSAPAGKDVTMSYATSDGSATAGTDYDAVSGTLTLAAGETSKTIDVPLRGDAAAENNETFFVTLTNVTGAPAAKLSGFAVIEDDDAAVDVALAADFSNLDFPRVAVKVSNAGPSVATNLVYRATASPNTASVACQTPCVDVTNVLAPGAAPVTAYFQGTDVVQQQYVTVTAAARQPDAQQANNRIAWTASSRMAMDALYLTPGADATLWIGVFSGTSFTLSSSDPSIVAVPATVAIPAGAKVVSVPLHGGAAGRATIRAVASNSATVELTVDVIAPGTPFRVPGALDRLPQVSGGGRFENPVTLTINPSGAAPFTGAHPTGDVTIATTDRELGRVTLDGSGTPRTVTFYLPVVGSNPVSVGYFGDANFLPQTISVPLQASAGNVSIAVSPVQTGTTVTMRVNVIGAPTATPTGTVTINEQGVLSSKKATLEVTREQGVAHADVTFTDIGPGQHTFVVAYSGDVRYNPSSQQVRTGIAGKREGVRH